MFMDNEDLKGMVDKNNKFALTSLFLTLIEGVAYA